MLIAATTLPGVILDCSSNTFPTQNFKLLRRPLRIRWFELVQVRPSAPSAG